MGLKEVILTLPVGYNDDELRKSISRKLGVSNFTFHIVSKSLDARKKSNITWVIKAAVSSGELKGGEPLQIPETEILYRKRNKKVVVTGSGPAGFFSAFVLQKAGFEVTLIERGREVKSREKAINRLEKEGIFDDRGNYAFGEGGAGTFSDGKLTSRSKHISKERQFLINSYIKAGAPEEIAYLAHPHLGSDNLKIIVRNLREEFERSGGKILFETMLTDIVVDKGVVGSVITDKGTFEADYCIIAPGHSAYETYRMLMSRGVKFRPKNFAIGSRMEHPQRIINLAQWGMEKLPGVKAAEYRLTSNPEGKQPVYTFCMCPGGIVVPASAYPNTNIVNGMSLYRRDLEFANAACVAGVNPAEFFGQDAGAEDVLDRVEELEMKFFEYSGGFSAPFCTIEGFINKKTPARAVETSYPNGLIPAPLWELLPEKVSVSMREGLKEFKRKIKGFETGIIMGLESKTSAPLQVLREEDGTCTGFGNLYIAGEGSGYAGGIVSSGSDGIRIAIKISGDG